jgi:hypothetical protein
MQHTLSKWTPAKRALHLVRLASARAAFQRAQSEYRAAEARQDTRKMGEAAARLRAANKALLSVEAGR